MRIGTEENLDDVKEGFQPLPKGRYLMVVREMDPTGAKDGSTYLKGRGEILEDEEHAGKVVFFNLSMKVQALWKVKEFLKAADVGWDENSFELDDCTNQEMEILAEPSGYCKECDDGSGKLGNFTPIETEEGEFLTTCPKCEQEAKLGTNITKFLKVGA